MGLFTKIFGSENDRNLKKIYKIADSVQALEEEYKQKSDEQLKAKTDEFKKLLSEGKTLDDILPEAFATVREACARVLGLRPYYVQVVGGIVLHQGRIAEMKTGEGKTLTETLPAYLNALTGNGVHIVTVNDYLARRDEEWMGKVFRFLGLTVGCIESQMDPALKRQAYNADITYGTNNEFGFDYLRDNMVVTKSRMVQRDFNFAIVDEVDSILIDEARTPLIISGQGTKSSEMYIIANRFAKTLLPGVDFEIDEKEKSINLTDDGVQRAEKFFKVSNLADLDNTELNHYIRQALKANYIMKRDSDYIVSDGEVLIVDEFTGRIMIGRRYNEGLHQAIEAKENVRVRSEDKTLATVTLQNYFRLYKKLSGMTGTAKTEEEEFKGIYGLDVVEVPTNLPMIRVDEEDIIYTTKAGKMRAIVRDVKDCYDRKQPVLIGTITVEKSEELSKMLTRERIPHNVLNAKNHKKEAEIIAQAGRKGAVTIATNMAGRGTDIRLGGNPDYMARTKMESDGYKPEIIEAATSFAKIEDPEVLLAKAEYERHYEAFKKITDAEKEEVIKAGGLRIIGTERHESRRIDNQLRGRSGRQGDAGSSVFYISLEDDLARIFGGDKLQSVMGFLKVDDDTPISHGMVSKQIEKAQRMVESRNYSVRKHVLSYDDVMNKQREIIYGERMKVLKGLDMHEQILKMLDPVCEQIIGYHADYNVDFQSWDYDAFNRAIEQRLLPEGTNFMTPERASCMDVYKLKEQLIEKVTECYEAKIAAAKEDGVDFGDIERIVMLRTVDSKWMDHIDAMDQLRKGIGLRAYGQRDPIIAYRQEGFEMFDDMIDRIQTDTVCTLMKIVVEKREDGSNGMKVEKKNAPKTAVRGSEKVGRNDPCPCGSGKKYKNCCGRNL